MPTPRPWRFVARIDIPELGICAGDLITVTAGRPIRITRSLPANPGLLLNLVYDGSIIEVDGFVGSQRGIMEAIERVDASPSPRAHLRLVRDDPAAG